MTDKQLFEAFGGVREKYLAEMLDDEPQRALELRPVKRSPIKKAIIAVTACAAAVGVVFGGLAISGKIDLTVLFGGSRGIVQSENYANTVSEKGSIRLENFIIEDDFLKDYPDKYAETLRGTADHDYNTVTAKMKLSFSAWDLAGGDTVVAKIRFFADGEKLNHLPIEKSMYSYFPDPLPKYIDLEDIFDPVDHLVRGDLGHFSLNKSKADNADDKSEEKFFEFTVTFDVKKDTSQITAMVEFVPFSSEYPGNNVYLSNDCEKLPLDEIITQTFPIGAMSRSESYSVSPNKINIFNTEGSGWFETEKGSGNGDCDILTIFSDNRTLKVNISEFNTKKTPYYLMVFQEGEPIECFDGKISKLIDPADPDNETLLEIPQKFVIPNGQKRELRLMAIPVIDDEKYSGGVYAVPISKRYYCRQR